MIYETKDWFWEYAVNLLANCDEREIGIPLAGHSPLEMIPDILSWRRTLLAVGLSPTIKTDRGYTILKFESHADAVRGFEAILSKSKEAAQRQRNTMAIFARFLLVSPLAYILTK